MDPELAELKETVARIDERTDSIHTAIKNYSKALSKHEDHDRDDFKEVHHRITKVERRQNWMLGIGTAGVFVLTMVAGFFKGIFGI